MIDLKLAYIHGMSEYLDKESSFLVNPLVGGILGHSAAEEGKKSTGTGIGVMAGLSSAIGSKAGENVAQLMGFEGGAIAKNIGALAGIMAFKTLYDMNPGGESVFQNSEFSKNIMAKFTSAQRAAGKLLDVTPYSKKIKSFWENNVETVAPDAIDYIKNMFSKLD